MTEQNFEILRDPTVYVLARFTNGPERYYIARTIRRLPDGAPERQALSVDGAWVDREDGFTPDKEVTFTGDQRAREAEEQIEEGVEQFQHNVDDHAAERARALRDRAKQPDPDERVSPE